MCVCTYTHISKYILLLFGCLVMSDSLQSHGLQHARLPCSSPSPGALLKLMSTEVVTASNHLVLCHPLLLLLSIFPSIRVFPNESAFHIRWPKYWSFSFSISPSEGIWWTAILEERRKTVMSSKEMFLSSVVLPPKCIMYQTLVWTISNVNSFNSHDKSPGRCYLHFSEKENEGHKS